jgi:hypothetical protein
MWADRAKPGGVQHIFANADRCDPAVHHDFGSHREDDAPVGSTRRSFERVDVELSVGVRDLLVPEQSFRMLATNISGGGAFLRTDTLLEVGKTIRLKVSDGAGGSLEINGEVTRCTTEPMKGVAIRFIGVQPQLLFRLALMLERIAPNTEDLPKSSPGS